MKKDLSGEAEKMDLTNYINFIITVTVRNMVICVKYGFYSDEQLYLFHNYYLSDEINSFQLLVLAMMNNDTGTLMKKINQNMDMLKIEEALFSITV